MQSDSLRQAYNRVFHSIINVNNYQDRTQDAVFDMITAESALAGIADQLLATNILERECLPILENELMNGTNWVLIDGSFFDLILHEELLSHANLLTDLQQKCRTFLAK